MIGARYVDMPWQNVQVSGTESLVERICKNCRFWVSTGERKDDLAERGHCTSLNLNTDYRVFGDTDLCATDDRFFTGPRFGCVHFAEKDAPEDAT